jgi:excisionase family DNA binding protein
MGKIKVEGGEGYEPQEGPLQAMNIPDQERPADNPDLWTLAQSAAFLGVSGRGLLELLRQGALRYVRRGLRVRIHRAELDRYREQHPA